jgi:hypothetical protein
MLDAGCRMLVAGRHFDDQILKKSFCHKIILPLFLLIE